MGVRGVFFTKYERTGQIFAGLVSDMIQLNLVMTDSRGNIPPSHPPSELTQLEVLEEPMALLDTISLDCKGRI